MNPSDDPRIQAIRKDPLVGKGTCSVIDECYSDKELLITLDEDKVTLTNCIEWAQDIQQDHLEQALNARWGEDSDPEVKEYRDFKKARGNHD